ncbi:Receptor-like kinase [Quillaja saponaria]|uniref:Receptor-like kinase n=1 Tax=Quillaja saponaria TaxID=32244 RepID=A0AAD7PXZ4_QUISA|nr:Receptor-like kinase [Quillaja saponaria]
MLWEKGDCLARVIVPIIPILTGLLDFLNISNVGDALRRGFDVKWKVGIEECDECKSTDGVCGYDLLNQTTTCYCQGQSSGSKSCPHLSGSSSRVNFRNLKFLLAFSFALIFTIIFIIIVVVSICKKFPRKVSENDQHVEAFIRNQELLATKRYTYSDVKNMTKAFADKVGQGGCGAVYQGQLADGRLVAVKVLNESKENAEEFVNEVASISRTSHVNVVSLLGFCYQRKKRALIYEFMSNGSLDKFIYSKGTSDRLEWKTLHEIATGIARGLEYLHRGCSKRILHFDIKPQNILLDENFCPKISDFGLAKLCKREDSAVSMLGARGTVGYIAPEVFCRNFGKVSYKSDVYSYGMMIFEMVGIKKDTDVGMSHTTSDVYFPNSIYKRLEVGEELRLDGVIKEEDEEISRKMILVSLWCIQTNPSDRPSMSEVVEMLEGSLQSLQLPPMPFLSSPPRSPGVRYSTSSSTSTS